MSHYKTFQYPKSPSDRKDYVLDWRKWLSGATISSYTVSATGATINSHSESNGIINIVVEGGTDRTDALITCQITTSNGLIATETVRLLIRD